jgi:hypothetical protein
MILAAEEVENRHAAKDDDDLARTMQRPGGFKAAKTRQTIKDAQRQNSRM